MGVDGNFRRLESEVDRLLGVLEQFRQENETLRAQVEAGELLKVEIEELKARIAKADEENRQATADREQVRGKIQEILARLEQVAVEHPEAAE
jgi:predicted transcriptional regulator